MSIITIVRGLILGGMGCLCSSTLRLCKTLDLDIVAVQPVRVDCMSKQMNTARTLSFS